MAFCRAQAIGGLDRKQVVIDNVNYMYNPKNYILQI